MYLLICTFINQLTKINEIFAVLVVVYSYVLSGVVIKYVLNNYPCLYNHTHIYSGVAIGMSNYIHTQALSFIDTNQWLARREHAVE